MNKYLRSYKKVNGFTKISSIGDGDLKLIEFGIINLEKGGEHSSDSGKSEVVLLILGGKCSVSGNGFEFQNVGSRKDVYSGKPYMIYIPCGKKYVVTTETNVEIAWISTPSTLKTDAYLITPEQVKEAHLGKENYQRDAYLILTDAFPSAHLFFGEAFVPSGNHASYPPHRHDFDNLPVEVDMEEIYFFRFNPEQGYGIQKIYTDDNSIDFTCTVKQNDTTLIPRGYHPVINAPGYTMYYLWIMAGQNNRKFLSVIDPTHKWVLGK
ncbi:MAG: 5-deoxy-glucuronate isomerase [Kiritimatiellae bacterium]|nr:5-deoxy-glucuronate isomerase [Kiritimatiellia bacterium]MDD5519672.1 5-deoxy-glucuronate isomerase [Kiritimatiellia bacterium]